MLSRTTLVAAAVVAALQLNSAIAQDHSATTTSAEANASSAGPSEKVKATIKAELEAHFRGVSVESITPTPMKGVWEVKSGKSLLYSDDTGKFVIVGELYETETRTNLTAAVKQKMLHVDFASLPLNLAIKTVKGNGKRVFATFEDPNCSYCKKMQAPLAEMTDYTMYTFIDPILSPDSMTKAQSLWCATDPSAAWKAAMQTGAVAAAKPGCAAPIGDLVALGRKLNVDGTPTIIFPDGTRAPGLLNTVEFERRLNQSSVVASAK